jgi:type I restriction enzyme, S subunit
MEFEMPSGWRWMDLGRLAADIRYGYTASATDEDVGPKFLRITDIVGGWLNWDQVPYCPINEHELDRYRLHEGDIVIARTGASAGVSAYCSPPCDAVFASYLVRFRMDPSQADPRFVGHVLGSPSWREFVAANAAGSAQPQLNASIMRTFELAVPPLAEQVCIASVLGALDDKIDSNRRFAGLLEETAATVFRARFVDFVGVEKFEDTDIGRVPRGWRAGSLSDLVELTMGQSPPGSSYSLEPDGALLLVQGMGGFGVRYPTSQVYTSAPTKRARPGATLMTVRAPVGAVNIARSEVCLGRGVAGFASGWPAFTEFLIRSLRRRWGSEESGTIFPAVNRGQVLGLPIVVPPHAEIVQFEEFAAPLVKKLATQSEETESLVAVRDALLPKLISGEIRVAA